MAANPVNPLRDFHKTGRYYAVDIATALILFFTATLMAGRVWRFPFDDEVTSLSVVERSHSALELARSFLAGNDIHPPLSYLWFYGLHQLGLGEAGIRLCSVALMAMALALFHRLTLKVISERSGAAVPPSTRIIAILLFGLCSLAISQGDAIRWYPLFAFLVALFVTLYLAGSKTAAKMWSAVPLGLAASTNFIAALVLAPFLLYRYALQRQFRRSFELTYWPIVAVLAVPGFWSAYSVGRQRLLSAASSEFGNAGVMHAVGTDILGFFGGHALGVGHAWVIAPLVAIAAIAMASEIDRKDPANPVHLLLLMLLATVPMAIAGFAKPRSFLYLAPVMAAILVLFLHRVAARRDIGWTILLASLAVAPSIAAIANIQQGTRPFKRNAVIPFQEILDFIATNGKGRVVVISSDPVLVWLLQHQDEHPDRCVSHFMQSSACFADEPRPDAIFVVSGHSDREAVAPAFIRTYETRMKQFLAGREKLAMMFAGRDKDAALKSRMSGIPLSEHILTVDLYR